MNKKGRKQKRTKWDNAKQNNKSIKGSKTYIRETAKQEKRKGGQGQTEKTMTKGTRYRNKKKERKFSVRIFSERHDHKKSIKQLPVNPCYLRHFSPLIRIIKCNLQFHNKILVRAVPSKCIQNFSKNWKIRRWVWVYVREVLNYTLTILCMVVWT